MGGTIALCLTFTACGGDDDPQNDDPPAGDTGAMDMDDDDMDIEDDTETDMDNLVQVVASTADLSSLLTVIQYIDTNGSQEDTADLDVLLSGDGPFTIFAPNNAAFDAVLDVAGDGNGFDDDDLAALEDIVAPDANDDEQREALADALYLVVANHAASGRLLRADLTDGQAIPTLASATDADNFGVTVDLTTGVVVTGTFAQISATVVDADVMASNGVAHVIDQIILDEDTASILGLADSDSTLVDAVVANDDLNSLELVIRFVDDNRNTGSDIQLLELLAGDGPFTVFAPNNAAFDAVLDIEEPNGFDEADLTALVGMLGARGAADALFSVVANHVTDGRLLSTDLTDGQEIDTRAGPYDPDALGIRVETTSDVIVTGSYSARPATVVGANDLATNGVAHIIDQLILDESTAATLALEEDDPTLFGLVESNPDLSSFLLVIDYVDNNGSQLSGSNVGPLLTNMGPLTLFAPNNAAFIPVLDLDEDDDFDSDDFVELESKLGGATEAADALYLVVLNHILTSRLLSADLTDGLTINTFAGVYNPAAFGILVDTSSGVVVSGSYDATPSSVVRANVIGQNGVAHIIDQIILDEATATELELPEDDDV